MMHSTCSEQTRFRRLMRWRANRPLTAQDASSRITAFVYGNILVLASLLALHPDDRLGIKAIAYVLGTGISTFVAHVVADIIGASIQTPAGRSHEAGRRHLKHHLADAVPIASSAVTPAVLLALVLLGWIDPTASLILAITITVLRLSGLGLIVGRLRQQRASLRTFLIGAMLGVICVVAAVLKWWLTH